MHKLTLDFETFYGKGYSLSEKAWTTESYIRAEQFKVHGCGVKLDDRDTVWVTASKLPAFFSKIPWSKVAFIGHNLQFDGFILSEIYGHVPKLYIDTLGMSRALLGQYNARHGLKYVAETLLNMTKMDELAKTYGIRDLPPWLEAKLADYCIGKPRYNHSRGVTEAGDCELTYEVFKKLAPYFPKKEFRALDWTIRKFCTPKLYFDDDILEEYLQEVIDGKQQALTAAGLETRDLLMSNEKYAQALLALNVVPPVKINDKGLVKYAFAKTDADHTALLEHDDPRVQAIVAARLAVKTTIEETRTQAYLAVAKRGAWPVAYSYSGAMNTHRLSGNKGGGGNPMNLKRGGKLRKAINAPPGYILLVFDLSQIECRMTLWYGMQSSKSRGMEREALELMANGGDLYSHFASMMFGREIRKKEDPNERQIGKSAVLGLGFGMGPARFMDYSITMGAKGVDAALAESTVYLYRNTYTGVKAFWYALDRALKSAIQWADQLKQEADQYGADVGSPTFWTWGPTRITLDPIMGSVSLQTGEGELMVKYPDLQVDAEGEVTYRDGNGRARMFGGKGCENIIQNGARGVLIDKKLELETRYEVVMSTYDEVVMLVPENEIEEAIAFAEPIMTKPHPLFPGLPIGVEYGYHKSYGHAKN